MKITLGRSGRTPVEIDLDTLLHTRMLIQANSGGGKSWLIRRLVEQMFGKVQIIVIDPEGEFPTLREKFGFVLVGKGGETSVHPGHAALVAQRLLELRASAVCDLYELKVPQRHRWVRLFLESLMNAPKELWHPVVVVVDEAHNYCPEKGESEAAGPMIDLATRGRKRGFCAVWATQRLAKLAKDAAAELTNILIGMTFIDIDRKRAAEALGISERKDQLVFFDKVKIMEHGNFYALGRAITKERVLFKVGPVQTTHPEPGSAKHAAAPPPAPAKIKKLLPKLADLPKEADEKAKTEAELRKELRSVKVQLREAEKQRPVVKEAKIKTKVGKVEVPTITDKQVKALEKQIDRLLIVADGITSKAVLLRKMAEIIEKSLASAKAAQQAATRPLVKKMDEARFGLVKKSLFTQPAPAPAPHPVVDTNGEDLTQPRKNIIAALAEFESLGQTPIPRTWVAVRAGASHKSSAFGNNLGALRSLGLIEYREGKAVALTSDGRQCISIPPTPATNEEMLESCLKLLSAPRAAILRVVHEAHPHPVGRDDIAEKAGASVTSSAFGNNLGALRSAGMIEYYPERRIKCQDWLFVED